jgi:hypothetical protein
MDSSPARRNTHRYPAEAPLLLLRNATLAPRSRRAVNGALAAYAASLRGTGPLTHTLVLWLQQYLPSIAAHFLQMDAEEEEEELEDEGEVTERQYEAEYQPEVGHLGRTYMRTDERAATEAMEEERRRQRIELLRSLLDGTAAAPPAVEVWANHSFPRSSRRWGSLPRHRLLPRPSSEPDPEALLTNRLAPTGPLMFTPGWLGLCRCFNLTGGGEEAEASSATQAQASVHRQAIRLARAHTASGPRRHAGGAQGGVRGETLPGGGAGADAAARSADEGAETAREPAASRRRRQATATATAAATALRKRTGKGATASGAQARCQLAS